MEVLDPIYYQFFFTTNNLRCKPITIQYFQSFIPQILELAAAASHWAHSEYVCGKKTTVMFSQDQYRGTFCPSTVLNYTPEATVLFNHTLVGHMTFPPCGTTPLG